MIKNGIRANLSPFRGLILAIFFTLGGLNCQAAANQCKELFADRYSPWIENLTKASPDAQKFWRDTGKKFQEDMQIDINNSTSVYKQAMDEKHPTLAFLFKLGFQYKAERFIVPDFFFMMKNLDFYRQTSAQPMELRLLWTLKHQQYGIEQAMILEPFQDFPANNMAYNIKTSLLPNEAFGKMIANGVFPIGGLETVAGDNRYNVKTNTGSYMLSEFMHDLSHVQALVASPAYAQAHKDVFQARELRWSQMAKKIGYDKMQNYRRMDDGSMTMFIFSESAWGFRPEYKSYINKTSVVQKLTTHEDLLTGKTLREDLSLEDQILLKDELKSIEKNWWKIVDIYGGAAGDLITYIRFDAKYQLPMNVVHESLKNLNNRTEAWNQNDFRDAALVLRFLREAPNFTPARWQFFALAKDPKKSKIYNSLRTIFEGHLGSQMSGFPSFAHYLGIRDTTQF